MNTNTTATATDQLIEDKTRDLESRQWASRVRWDLDGDAWYGSRIDQDPATPWMIGRYRGETDQLDVLSLKVISSRELATQMVAAGAL